MTRYDSSIDRDGMLCTNILNLIIPIFQGYYFSVIARHFLVYKEDVVSGSSSKNCEGFSDLENLGLSVFLIWSALKINWDYEGVDIEESDMADTGVFPGMAIWEELIEQGLLTEEQENQHWEMGVSVAEIHPDTVPYEEIKSLVRHYYRQFFIRRPRYLFEQLARTMRSPFRLSVVKANLSRISNIIREWQDFVAFEGEQKEFSGISE